MFTGGGPQSYEPNYGYRSRERESSYARVRDTKTSEQKEKEAYEKRMKEWGAYAVYLLPSSC